MMRTEIAGLSHKNVDGTPRKDLIQKCKPGQYVRLEPEPENKFDPNAIMVLTEEGVQLGYIPALMAKTLKAGGVPPRAEIECVMAGPRFGAYPRATLVIPEIGNSPSIKERP